MEYLNKQFIELSIEEKKEIQSKIRQETIRNESTSLFKYCKNMNFNVLVDHPEKVHHSACSDFKNGEPIAVSSHYFIGEYSKEKEDELMKELTHMIHKLRVDMNDDSYLKRILLGIASNCHVQFTVSYFLKKYCSIL